MKITDENMYENLEFTCVRCGAKASKTAATDPEYGYISMVDGRYTGPICEKCAHEIKRTELVVKPVLETAFIVGIQANGEGIIVKDDDISVPYLRDPTALDIKNACHEIIDNINSVQLIAKLTGMLQRVQPRPFTLPKKG